MNQALRSIHVVAGVIVDARGRVLLGRRKMDSDQPGLWEFPGGKLEPGETSEQALVRELHEELGIEVQAIGERLIEVPQLYPDKRLRLEVRRVLAWQGTPRGKEGQALTWVAQDKLQTYSMPPADVPVVSALLHPDRYLVTPTPQGNGSAWLAGIARALASGITRVHLRHRGLDAVQWRELASQAVALCRKADADVLVNADVALARELGAGVHLQAAQLTTLEDRPLPADTLVAASCHDASQLQVAQRIGCDFAVVGSVNATPSHPGMAPIGWDGFVALRETVALPLYAIGGLSPLDIDQARQQGAQGVAAIRAFWED